MRRETTPRRTVPARVAVEFPGEGERIASRGCVFHIEGPARRVDIAIDGDGWRSCRRSADHWSFSWSGYSSGRHQAIIRSEPETGQEPMIETRRFVVELPDEAG